MPFAGYKDFADCCAKNSDKKNPKAYCSVIMRATEAEFSPEERQRLAQKGWAMPDGSYPIRNVADLERAIKAFGRSPDSKTKAHIVKRARALGRTDLLPAEWEGSTKKESLEVERTVNDLFDASEAEFSIDEATGGMGASITILKAGRSKNPRIYREEAVRKAAEAGIFNGARMFVNHSDQPPLKRSVTEMVSAVESTSYDSDKKAIVGNVKFFNKDFYEFAKNAKNYMGNSINALVRGERVRQPNGEVIEDVHEIVQGKSVDWVIYPAAGGEIQQFFESEGEAEVEWDKITLEDLKTNAPELYQAIREAAIQEAPKHEEGATSLTKEEVASIAAQAVADHEAKKAEEATKKAEVTAKVQEALNASGLPQKTRDRLAAEFSVMEAFDETVVKGSIDQAKEELKAAGAGPKITGMGPSGEGNVSTHPTGISVSEAVASEFGYKPTQQ